MSEALVERLRDADTNSQQRVVGSRIFSEAADRIEAIERELAEGKRRNAELDREITGLRNSYWKERKAHLAAEAREARLSEALRECIGYITSPLRLSDDGDEVARRNSIAVRARAALSGSNSGWRIEKMLEIISEAFGLVQALHAEQPDQQEITRCQQNLISVLSYEDWTIPADADELERMLHPAAPQPTGGE